MTLPVGFMPIKRCCILMMRDGCARSIMRVRIALASIGADIVVWSRRVEMFDVLGLKGSLQRMMFGFENEVRCDWSMRRKAWCDHSIPN